MERINKKMIKPFIVLGLTLLAAIGLTMAYYTSTKDFKNSFHTPKPGVAIHEKFNPSDWWVPEEEKSKQVWFSNTEEMDMLLRFRVEVTWKIPPKDADGDPQSPPFKDEQNRDNDIVKLYWKDSTQTPDKKPIRLPETEEEADQINGLKWLQDQHEKFEFTPHPEGDYIYYYYNKVLKAKNTDELNEITQHVLESVQFSPNLSNEQAGTIQIGDEEVATNAYHGGLNYSNVQINIDIIGETVLADKKDVLLQWGKNVTDVTIENTKSSNLVTWHFTP